MKSLLSFVCLTILLSISSKIFSQPTDDSLKVTVVDVGAGLCCVVDMPNDKYMIYDTGEYGMQYR